MNVQAVLVSLQSLLGEPNKYASPSPLPRVNILGVVRPQCWEEDDIPFCFVRLLMRLSSASPLNGQAAEFWDKDPAEFKRQVLLRHRDLEDDDE